MDDKLSYSLIANSTDENINLMNISELAEYLNIGRNTAYELLRKETIKGFRIGNTWKVSKAAVDCYVLKMSGLI
ncbi:excisionase family DNA binding protein [Lachnospiraceae bacterium PF1-22]|uniref:helix-turn-helix domain-containing protein n=1 Tax=Ohessyouella blattaphilus TaxID=2949333 RepID=UPI003E26F427